jgi:hypothetical protein
MSLVATYDFGDQSYAALSVVPCQPTRVTHAFLGALHPTGYRNFRALRKGGTPKTFNVPVDDLDEVDTFAKTCRDWNLYVGVATRAHANGGGALADCDFLYALFADLDFKDKSEVATRDRLNNFPLAPSAVVNSGGGLHAYWFLDEPLDLQNGGGPTTKAALRQLATALEADLSAAEPARILRLPGSLNHKYTPPRPVVLEQFTDRRYTLADLLAVLPEISSDRSDHEIPRTIGEAYRGHGGIRQAARDSDAQVAKRVAAWERRHGIPLRDWVAIGRSERDPGDEPPKPEQVAAAVARLLGAR